MRDVLITRTLHGVQGWIDHRLVRCKMRINIKSPRRAEHRVPAGMAFSSLVKNKDLRHQVDPEFGIALSVIKDDRTVDAAWRSFADSTRAVSQRVVSKLVKRNQDWFDNSDMEIWKLVEKYGRLLRCYAFTSPVISNEELFIRVS